MKKSLTVLTLIALSAFALPVARAEAAKDDGKVTLNGSQSTEELLTYLQTAKKKVNLMLRNGVTYGGKIGWVGPQSVVLTELTGKEFFDVRILLTEIVAVETQIRSK